VSRSIPLVVDRTLGALTISPQHVSPNGDGRKDRLSIDFQLTQSADVRVTIATGNVVVGTLFEGPLPPGPQHVDWDGALPVGLIADGAYSARVEATTALGTRQLAGRVVVDRQPPSVRVLSAVMRKNATIVRLRLSETVEIRVRGGGRSRVFDRAAGTRTVVVPASPRRLRLRAWDTAGNAGPPITVSPRR
jgi:hypothetical protein